MNNNKAKWYLLPGMGADASMYDLLRQDLDFEITFINWPKYRNEKTYSETAKRIIEENGIKEGDIVGGSSLGGMVAIEIAKQKESAVIVLLGSAICPAEIQGILTLLAPGVLITPISLVQLLVGKFNDIVTKMFTAADPNFISAMCQYLPKWPGVKELKIPLFRIHGEKDHVIPCPKTGCEVIPAAGHFVAITHAKVCVKYLNKINRQLTSARPDSE
jgi:pimeloyl-ACP methyl ester carboxylesterase